MSLSAEQLEPIPTPQTGGDYYLVNHGRNGLLGSFEVDQPMALARGARVVIQTARGLEMGTVLCPAGVRQARLLGATSSGTLLRIVTDDDLQSLSILRGREQALFEAGRRWVETLGLPLEIVDVELLLDGRQAWLNFVGGETVEMGELPTRLAEESGVEVHLENLAIPATKHDEAEHHGCRKPDCGKTLGGCSSCGSGGGCSTCGGTKVDLRPYFANLREHMEASPRVALN